MTTNDSRYMLSTEPDQLDMDLVCDKLSNESYWAAGRSHDSIRNSFKNSHCFGMYDRDSHTMVGFCRVVTDYSTVAYLLDFFILEKFRGQGLGKMMIEAVLSDPKTEAVNRWMLATRDAHTFYDRFGFKQIAHPEYFMEMWVNKSGGDNE